MAIVETVTSQGAKVTSSLSGGLTINEANGEIVIRNNGIEVVRIDKTGFKYYDGSGVERIAFGQDSDGLQQIIVYDANGVPQILIGQDPKDGSPVIANTTNGVNVVNDLKAD